MGTFLHSLIFVSGFISSVSAWSQTPAPEPDALQLKFYGFLRSEVIGASRALDSFGNPNLSAPVGVRPGNEADSQRARMSFQAAQSRLGLKANQGPVLGQIEMDFIDFAKASPTTTAVPRLRIAKIDWSFTSVDRLSIGQDWDLFSPEKPFTYNYVGLYFKAGNAGFMRQQIKLLHEPSEGWAWGAAAGLVTANKGAADSAVEQNAWPTLALRTSYRLDPKREFGVSAIYGKTRGILSSLSPPLRSIYGFNAFGEWGSGESPWSFSGEAYYGQNLGSAGALTLASASPTTSFHEWGAYGTVRCKLSERVRVQGGLGYAHVLEPQGSLVDGFGTRSIGSNGKAEVALSWHPSVALSWFLQYAYFRTLFAESGGVSDRQTVAANALSFGGVYEF